jgi:prevent-host-death family protein
MRTVSISQLKARLSEQLRRVRAGDPVIVTDRGTPVAMLSPLTDAQGSETMNRLVELGLARPPLHALPGDFADRARPSDPEGRLRRAVDEERRSGW